MTATRRFKVCTVSVADTRPVFDEQWDKVRSGIEWTAIVPADHDAPAGPDRVVVLPRASRILSAPVPRNPRIPALGSVLGVVLRLVAANRASRTAARHVAASPEAMVALREADVVVCCDPLGERVAWSVARERRGVLAYAGTGAAARAISSLLAGRG